MRNRGRLLYVGVSMLVLAAAMPARAAVRIQWQTCPHNAMVGSAAAMDCGWLVSGEKLAGEPIRLRVVVLRARPDVRDAHPVVYIPGGPGASAGLNPAGLRAWRAWQQRAGWDHDIVLFDPRATGESRPRPGCGHIRDEREAAAATAASSRREFNDEARAARCCYQQLGAKLAAGLGPEAQLRDVQNLIDALGVARVNLWGVSYGTRIARLLAQRYPARVRAMVLDSLFPFERDDLLALPAQVGGAIAQLDSDCARQEDCHTHGQPPSATVHELLKRYATQPPTIVSQGPNGTDHAFVVTPYRLLIALVLAGYNSGNTADTVARLTRARAGDSKALKPLVARLWQQVRDDSRNEAVFWSTRCAFGDGVPEITAWRQALAAYPAIAAYLAPARGASICAFWAVPHVASPGADASLKAPTLVVAGDADRVTPATWTDRFIESHPEVRLFTLSGAGHGASLSNACAFRAIGRFWNNPRSAPTTECGAQSGR